MGEGSTAEPDEPWDLINKTGTKCDMAECWPSQKRFLLCNALRWAICSRCKTNSNSAWVGRSVTAQLPAHISIVHTLTRWRTGIHELTEPILRVKRAAAESSALAAASATPVERRSTCPREVGVPRRHPTPCVLDQPSRAAGVTAEVRRMAGTAERSACWGDAGVRRGQAAGSGGAHARCPPRRTPQLRGRLRCAAVESQQLGWDGMGWTALAFSKLLLSTSCPELARKHCPAVQGCAAAAARAAAAAGAAAAAAETRSSHCLAEPGLPGRLYLSLRLPPRQRRLTAPKGSRGHQLQRQCGGATEPSLGGSAAAVGPVADHPAPARRSGAPHSHARSDSDKPTHYSPVIAPLYPPSPPARLVQSRARAAKASEPGEQTRPPASDCDRSGSFLSDAVFGQGGSPQNEQPCGCNRGFPLGTRLAVAFQPTVLLPPLGGDTRLDGRGCDVRAPRRATMLAGTKPMTPFERFLVEEKHLPKVRLPGGGELPARNTSTALRSIRVYVLARRHDKGGDGGHVRGRFAGGL
eukprot:363309-Chlamydomonas_euryale.AAC.42